MHKTAGLWSIWFLLIMGATGVWYLFEHSRYRIGDGVTAYYGAGPSAENQFPEAKASDAPGLTFADLLAKAQKERPDIKTLGVIPDRSGYFYIDGQAGHLLVRHRANHIFLDKTDGSVIYNQNASDLPLYWR